ncbi:hypothetical protein BDW22DRAFT_1351937 [Trametopsis cervina]|nr:hypothetical protein BDW22DRAFT_1351937 [Trametopsis cervina]
MAPSSQRNDQSTFKELSQKVAAANKDHQYALKVYTERLEAELETVDKLLAAVDVQEDDLSNDVDVGGSIVIADAVKADGPVPGGIVFEDSPFAEDAARRDRYLKSTVIHPMKAAELDALSDAVQSENHRLWALEAQRKGQQPFVALDEHPTGFFTLNKEGLNWDRIASKVSSAGVNYIHRTAQECEVRWLGDRHPQFNHEPWTAEETDRVKQLVGDAKEGEVDWVDVAAKLGTRRTPVDCMRHAVERKAHVWTAEADARLLEAVKIYGMENWLQVARQVSEDATASQCQNRYARTVDPSITRRPWTSEEDTMLQQAVEVFGRSWVDVCIWVPGRTNEQCRERWQDPSKSGAKGPWTSEEDQLLVETYERVGGPKWKDISKTVGRPNDSCRGRYLLLIKRKAKASAASSTHANAPVPTGEQPIAGPSKPRTTKTARRSNKNPIEPQKDPALPVDEGSEPSAQSDTPAPNRPAVKPRPRKKAAATKKTTTEDAQGESSSLREQHDAAVTPSEPRPKPKPRPRLRGKASQAPPKGTDPPEKLVDSTITDTQPTVPPTANTADDAPQSEPIPQKRGRGRPRKRLQAGEELVEEPASKKKRIEANNTDEANGQSELPPRSDAQLDPQSTASQAPVLRRSARRKTGSS